MSSIEQPCVILVTGANRGIGFEVVKKLAENSLSNNTRILLGSRDVERGKNALKQLNAPHNVDVLQLDTSSKESIINAIYKIKNEYGGQLDIVINNAGISSREITVNAARELFNTNYYGIKILNEHVISLMRKNGRIVNVSSGAGLRALQRSSRVLQEKYTSSSLTTDQLDELVEEFVSSIENKSFESLGYNPQSMFFVYGVTKMALNALTEIEARQWSATKKVLVVSVNPGFCATDMTDRAETAEKGADSVLYVVNASPEKLENGGFYRNDERIPLTKEPQ